MTQNTDNTLALLNITQDTLYLMTGSFILGCLLTLLLIMFLDYVQRYKGEAYPADMDMTPEESHDPVTQ